MKRELVLISLVTSLALAMLWFGLVPCGGMLEDGGLWDGTCQYGPLLLQNLQNNPTSLKVFSFVISEFLKYYCFVSLAIVVIAYVVSFFVGLLTRRGKFFVLKIRERLVVVRWSILVAFVLYSIRFLVFGLWS